MTAERPLSIFAYGVGVLRGPGPGTHWEALAWLRERGFRTNPEAERLESIEHVAEACVAWEARRDSLGYEIDGIVIKVDSFDQQERLGSLHERPRFARAYKWAPTSAVTRLRKIHVRVGRTGVLNPLAELEPVHVGGVTVSSRRSTTRTTHLPEGHPRGLARDRPARGRRDPPGRRPGG